MRKPRPFPYKPTGFKCPHCGCALMRNRGNYAGNQKYRNEVQCNGHGCYRWSTLESDSPYYIREREATDAQAS
jgi:hypothetical protein